MATRQPRAFFSYTRIDDGHARGKLSALRARLEGELQVQLGAPFEIYQDTIDLTWGVDWQQRLSSGIDEAIFFIPVITPSYFASAACRKELEAFLQREQKLLYEELILPVYWMDTNPPNDNLTNIIKSRNYIDFRKLRHTAADHPDMDAKVETLATDLIQRLNEFNDHQHQIANLKASIVIPKQHAQVARRFTVTGKTESIPKTITPWLVVEAGARYHPQAIITTTTWNAKATVGGVGFGTNNSTYPIHVIATSKSANGVFANYLREQPEVKKWDGLQLPTGIRILATTTVRRDDHASALNDLIGTYEEYCDKPLTPTHSTISVVGTRQGQLSIVATNKMGQTEWKGTITVNSASGQASANYQNTSKGGGTLQLQQMGRDISVKGQDSTPGAKPFDMIWKRQAS